MSWLKFDDQYADHPKLKLVGPLGLALQTMAICYSGRYRTDGKLSFAIAGSLVRLLSSPWTDSEDKRWECGVLCGHVGRDADEYPWAQSMVDAGLWDVVEDGYIIHDFDKYNPTSNGQQPTREELSDKRREAGKRGAKARWGDSKTEAIAKGKESQLPMANGSKTDAPVPVPVPREEDPPTPLQGLNDPVARSFAPIRADVIRLHQAYQSAFGMTGHVLRNANDANAMILAEAIDQHTETVCMLVLKHARHDGMVSGKLDDKNAKHDSIRYIFGNPDTFARILRSANETEGKGANRITPAEAARRARAL